MTAAARLVLVAPTVLMTDRARALGIETFVVTTKARSGIEDIGPAQRVLVVDELSDPQIIPIIRASHAVAAFDGVASLTEYGLEPAARIAEALAIRGTSLRAVELTRNKVSMRETLAAAGLLSPVAAQRARTADEVLDFGSRNGYPIFVKPAEGVGSAGVWRADSPDDVHRRFTLAPDGADMIVEEFLTGPEISAECFTAEGAHHVVAVTEKGLIGGEGPGAYVELSHAMPARLTVEVHEAVVATTVAALTALGVNGGPSHTELKLTPNGPRIIETHTRIGGDHLPDLVTLATGVDLGEQTLRWAAGLPTELTSDRPGRAAAIRFFAPPAGPITAVHGMRRLDGLPGVVRYHVTARAGSTATEITRSKDRSGYVLTTAATTAEAIARAEHAANLVTFESDTALAARRPLNE